MLRGFFILRVVPAGIKPATKDFQFHIKHSTSMKLWHKHARESKIYTKVHTKFILHWDSILL